MPFDAQPFNPAMDYTPPEVAQEVPFTVKTLAQWRWRGIGPGFRKLHGRIFYGGEALNAWLAAAQHGGEAS